MVHLEKKIRPKTFIITYLGTVSNNVVDSQELFPKLFREGTLISSDAEGIHSFSPQVRVHMS